MSGLLRKPINSLNDSLQNLVEALNIHASERVENV